MTGAKVMFFGNRYIALLYAVLASFALVPTSERVSRGSRLPSIRIYTHQRVRGERARVCELEDTESQQQCSCVQFAKTTPVIGVLQFIPWAGEWRPSRRLRDKFTKYTPYSLFFSSRIRSQ